MRWTGSLMFAGVPEAAGGRSYRVLLRWRGAHNDKWKPWASCNPFTRTGRRRKPMLARDGSGVAQHGHGVQTRTWKNGTDSLEDYTTARQRRPVQQYDAFSYKRGPWSILRISRKSALRSPRLTRSRSCTISCTRMVSDHARAARGLAWRYRPSRTK